MKKLVLLSTLCALITPQSTQAGYSSQYKFSYFQVWDPATKKISNSLTLSPDTLPASFYIVMPEAPQSIFVKDKDGNSVGFASQDVKFFLSNRRTTEKSVILVLDWLDSLQKSETDKIISEAGTEIKNFMTTFDKPHPRMPYTFVGLGRGGVVAAGIVNQEHLPKQVELILIGVPFAQDTLKYASYSTIDPAYITNAYVFYNNIPYRGSPLLPPSTNRPKSFQNKTYFIRTIANNKEQPAHKISFLTLQDVLDACDTARAQYAAHKELWASFSNIKPDTHGLVGILKQSASANKFQINKEKLHSSAQAAQYKKSWGSTSILSKSGTTPIRSTYKLETPSSSQKLASKSA